MSSILPEAGKTPTTEIRKADMAAAVDGSNMIMCIDGRPSQGPHVVSPPILDYFVAKRINPCDER